MEKIATENLFLLEFLVDSVDLNPKCDCGEGERCVSFQFLDNAPLDVCEEDFTPPSKQQENEKDQLKSGKSCLFSLSPDQANRALNQFDIYVTILKKMPAGWLPEKVEIGEALISIANLFSELINSVESSDGTTPTAKTLKDSFDIVSSTAERIGKIGVYIRMSCFGKLIVTQFQMNLGDKSVLFKDKEGKSLYRYKKAGKGRKGKQETCTPRQPPSAGNSRMQGQHPGMGRGNMGSGGNVPPCPISPCVMIQPPGNGMGGPICPFTPCMLDQLQMGQYGQPNGNPRDRLPPCKECGSVPNAPCIQMQGRNMGMGAGMGVGMSMGMGAGMAMGRGMGMGTNGAMSPCIECGNIPNAPCLPQGGMARSGGMTPCVECGNLTNAPCIAPQGGMARSGGMTPCVECGNLTNAPCIAPQGGMARSGGMTPCVECGNLPNAPCVAPGEYPYSSPNVSNTPCLECAGLANPPCAPQPEPDGNYQEIGASMGGNSLTIRVHKDKNKVEQIDPNTGAGVASDTNSETGCCCSPGKMGKKSRQDRTLNMRPGIQQGNQDMPFAFKMGKSGDGGSNVVVNPPVATAPDGTKFTEFSDPNKELFILRVGKKSEGIDKKQNLELELCTPRGKVM